MRVRRSRCSPGLRGLHGIRRNRRLCATHSTRSRPPAPVGASHPEIRARTPECPPAKGHLPRQGRNRVRSTRDLPDAPGMVRPSAALTVARRRRLRVQMSDEIPQFAHSSNGLGEDFDFTLLPAALYVGDRVCGRDSRLIQSPVERRWSSVVQAKRREFPHSIFGGWHHSGPSAFSTQSACRRKHAAYGNKQAARVGLVRSQMPLGRIGAEAFRIDARPRKECFREPAWHCGAPSQNVGPSIGRCLQCW